MTPPHKPIIGIIGGIGSGKSTIARQFAALGCGVIDADALAREALAQPATITQLLQWWGRDVVQPDGKADRAAIAKIVFGDATQLARLESVTHPYVLAQRTKLREEYRNNPAVIAIIEDCPLLLEKNLEGDCDAIVFVRASNATRQDRVKSSRGWSPDELERREKKQMALDMKARRADYVIENDGGEAESFTHVRQVLSQILQQTA
jgi:dephospho-CoA kinase